MCYQQAHGLPVTGVVDVTMADLLGVHAYAGGSPAGWAWSGWGFNSSYALIGGSRASSPTRPRSAPCRRGRSKALPAVEPLFEGFVRDIVAGGYQITDIGTYVFRCTSNTRKDCQGLTRSSLSNHSYGLALDMNTAANPEIRYANCQLPLQVDIPQWVVQAAEKWGLYWGGYGWGKGCASASDTSTGVIRDSMHFEFRGTPAQAAAILAANGGLPDSLAPVAGCADFVDDAGLVTAPCLDGARPAAATRLVVDTDAPADATAALVNITAVDPVAEGYVTAEPCGADTAGDALVVERELPQRPERGQPLGGPDRRAGWFCVYSSASTHVVVDVQGYIRPGGGSLLNVIEPRRVADTRTGPTCATDGTCAPTGPVAAGAVQQIDIAGIGAATAALVNLTVTNPAGGGYLTADACGSLQPGEQTRSNANFAAGVTVANLGIVPTSASAAGRAICTVANRAANTVVDVQGYFAPATAAGWV